MSDSGYVVITRPEGEAQGLAAEVRALGYKPLTEPMMTIIPTDVVLPSLDMYQALVFTSANGVRVFSTLSGERRHKVYCTGDASAAAARECGWQNVASAGGDAADLMALLAAGEFPAGTRLLHPSGEYVAREIVVPGLDVERLTIYSAEAAKGLSAPLLEILDEGTLDMALFFSARTAGIFAELLERAERTQAVRSTKALCIADSVVKSLRHLEWQDVQVSTRPDRESLLGLLRRSAVIMS